MHEMGWDAVTTRTKAVDGICMHGDDLIRLKLSCFFIRMVVLLQTQENCWSHFLRRAQSRGFILVSGFCFLASRVFGFTARLYFSAFLLLRFFIFHVTCITPPSASSA